MWRQWLWWRWGETVAMVVRIQSPKKSTLESDLNSALCPQHSTAQCSWFLKRLINPMGMEITIQVMKRWWRSHEKLRSPTAFCWKWKSGCEPKEEKQDQGLLRHWNKKVFRVANNNLKVWRNWRKVDVRAIVVQLDLLSRWCVRSLHKKSLHCSALCVNKNLKIILYRLW